MVDQNVLTSTFEMVVLIGIKAIKYKRRKNKNFKYRLSYFKGSKVNKRKQRRYSDIDGLIFRFQIKRFKCRMHKYLDS